MTVHFDPNKPPIVLEALVAGPNRTWKVKLALDTGATDTLIGASILAALGIPVLPTTRRKRLRSATGGATAPVVNVRQLLVLGHVVADFAVIAHDLPPAIGYHGLLGLDFFRGQVLMLDFARGRIGLHSSRPWWRFWR